MNYEQARQRQSDARWDWTNMRAQAVWPLGYCAGWPSDEAIARTQALLAYPGDHAYPSAEMLRNRGKYHTDGHATKTEAERCYYEYELDRLREVAVRVLGVRDGRLPCEAMPCREYTTLGLEVVGQPDRVALCDAHRTRDGYAVARPFQPGGYRIHS